MVNLSVIAMIVCLAGEGVFLLFAGLPFPGLPLSLYAAGCVWIFECLSVAFFKRHPHYALISGWIMFGLMVTVLSQNKNFFHTPKAFLYQHSLEIIFLAAAHLGHFAVRRKRRT
ncbi:hypothetical protein [Terriglobus albidus]|uniref:hypothetical protein n=1 Tax=Terriglobus albidus TaxID=1592106 RepID=UPI0021DFB5B7|nr:hypothetical protein [Terriglobus albidus]